MAHNRVFYESVGKRIQQRRADKMTQEKLGSLLEPPITRAAIANMEAGKQGILVLTLVQIAKQLGVEPTVLLPSDPSDSPQQSAQIEAELFDQGVPRATTKKLSRRIQRPTERSEDPNLSSQLVNALLREGVPKGTSRRLAGRLSRTSSTGLRRRTQ